jgi:hypothetical protein
MEKFVNSNIVLEEPNFLCIEEFPIAHVVTRKAVSKQQHTG